MKLKQLREHYNRNGLSWIPKKSFNSVIEIKKELGFEPEDIFYYTCGVCQQLHLSSGPPRFKVKS